MGKEQKISFKMLMVNLNCNKGLWNNQRSERTFITSATIVLLASTHTHTLKKVPHIDYSCLKTISQKIGKVGNNFFSYFCQQFGYSHVTFKSLLDGLL